MSSEPLVGRFTIGELIKKGAITAHKDGNFGSLYPKISDFSCDGVPLLTAKVINKGVIDFNSAQKLTKEKADTLQYGFIQTGDVLLAHNATVGRVAVVPTLIERALVGTSLTYFRLDQSRLLPRYLAAFFESRDFQNQLAAVMGLSTRNQVPITAQRLLEIDVPSIEDQNKISTLIGSLDDRITLLREINNTLESVAQAIFKSWFVDFDPVRANMEGRPPEGMDEETATLFPDSFEESGVEKKPQGWSSDTLSAIMRLHKGTVNPGAAPNVVFRHFSLPAYDAGQLPIVELGQTIKSNKTEVPENGVLLSKLNPHIPRVWLPSVVKDHSVCSTEFLPFVPQNGFTTAFIYVWLSSPSFTARIQGLVTGTSNSHQRIKPDNILSMEAIIPPASVVEKFDGIVNGLFERVKANRMIGKTLADLRDNLLPRLISGQLRLPEAQAQVENALL